MRRPKSGSHESTTEPKVYSTPERPRGINTHRQHYAKFMLRHMTNLFRRRPHLENSLQLQQHVKLCLRALKTYRDICDPSYSQHVKLNRETWETLLHVTLGITMYVMSGTDTGEARTKERTAEQKDQKSSGAHGWKCHLGGTLIATVCEVWLRSTTNIVVGDVRSAMWSMFVKSFPTQCLTTTLAVEQFHAVLLHVTSSVTAVLWSREKKKKVQDEALRASSIDTNTLVRIVWPHALLSPCALTLAQIDLIHICASRVNA